MDWKTDQPGEPPTDQLVGGNEELFTVEEHHENLQQDFNRDSLSEGEGQEKLKRLLLLETKQNTDAVENVSEYK